jgi:7,8-dihydropterin-6-yl-methyl-4-(beta-D-ribofuranosyl)aminobenzene 5'-phosphate synthase
MFYLSIIIGFFIGVFAIILLKLGQLNAGKEMVQKETAGKHLKRLSPFGSVKSLTILPLVDFYSDRKDLKTEPGVSYLVKGDDTTILMDVGYNAKKEHPSPLLHNMKKLGISPKDIDMIFISHPHLDHLGGVDEQKKRVFDISKGDVELPGGIKVYSPSGISAGPYNAGAKNVTVDDPFVIKEGIASTGSIPRYLFLMGYTPEQSLAVNVEGKGIVLVVGCGHPTIERIIERAKAVFDEPIYAIIGGLHFPVRDGRIKLGPVNLQNIVGSDRPPWIGIGEKDVFDAIEAIKAVNPKVVSLSPHDSSDWSIEQFKTAFGDKYADLKAGKEIMI